MFEFEKPKRSQAKRTQITLNEFNNEDLILLDNDTK